MRATKSPPNTSEDAGGHSAALAAEITRLASSFGALIASGSVFKGAVGSSSRKLSPDPTNCTARRTRDAPRGPRTRPRWPSGFRAIRMDPTGRPVGASVSNAFTQDPWVSRRPPGAVDAFLKLSNKLECRNRDWRQGLRCHPVPTPLLKVVWVACASGQAQLLRATVPLALDRVSIHLALYRTRCIPLRHEQFGRPAIAFNHQARRGPPHVLARLRYAMADFMEGARQHAWPLATGATVGPDRSLQICLRPGFGRGECKGWRSGRCAASAA